MINAFLNRLRDDDEPPRPDATPSAQEGAAVPAGPFGERMRHELDGVRWEARRAGGKLPIAALPQLGRIEDVLLPLLDHLASSPPSVDEEIAVQAMVTDYLPTTLHAYLGLNRQFAQRAGRDGRTPGDDLLDQLRTLEAAAHELSEAVYAHDVQQLQTQGRFLRAKFERSDLAL